MLYRFILRRTVVETVAIRIGAKSDEEARDKIKGFYGDSGCVDWDRARGPTEITDMVNITEQAKPSDL